MKPKGLLSLNRISKSHSDEKLNSPSTCENRTIVSQCNSSSPIKLSKWTLLLKCFIFMLFPIAQAVSASLMESKIPNNKRYFGDSTGLDLQFPSQPHALEDIPCECEDEEISPSSVAFFGYIIGSVVCVGLGAVMSGLQVGYFSLDPMKLRILLQDRNTSKKDRDRANRVLPLLAQHHFLLVTLLVANAAAMETLPICLDRLVPSAVAILLSVTFILFFGEVIPQALCTNSPLAIGAFFTPLVRVLMVITFPVSYPVAKLLDRILGHESMRFMKRTELSTLLELHLDDKGGSLEVDEVNILRGALSIRDKKVMDIATPMSSVFMINVSAVLNFEILYKIFQSGYSRIPVYDDSLPAGDNIVGLLLTKDVILIDPENAVSIRDILQLNSRPLQKVFPDTSLKDLLSLMRSGRTHMAIVHDVIAAAGGDPFRKNIGIITLEDVLEELLQLSIEDESDMDTFGFDDVETEKTGRRLIAERFGRRRLPARLTPQELNVVRHHLQSNCALFRKENTVLDDQQLTRILNHSEVIEVKADNYLKKDSVDRSLVDISHGGRSLYRRDVANDYMTLILEGNAIVIAGAEGYKVTQSQGAMLGTLALQSVHPDPEKPLPTIDALPSYIPDFSAHLTTNSRVLRVSRAALLHELRIASGLDCELDTNDINVEGMWKEGGGGKNSKISANDHSDLPPSYNSLEVSIPETYESNGRIDDAPLVGNHLKNKKKGTKSSSSDDEIELV